MYVSKKLASDFDEPFKKTTEIVVEEIVTPLQPEARAALSAVFDYAYYGDDRVVDVQNIGHNVVYRLKFDKQSLHEELSGPNASMPLRRR